MTARRLVSIIPLWSPLLVAAALRTVVLASGAVSFHSDEAIVGLMARHINQGLPIPVFFYGQPYMGSLDPLPVAAAFRLVGERVLTIRLVQSALYLCVVATTIALAFRLTRSQRIAGVAGLLVAVPPVVMTLYTTVSLGGYGETLLLGNLLLLVGYDLSEQLVSGDMRSLLWRWLALGALAGLGWWTNSLIVAYVLPVAVVLLRCWRHLRWRMVVLAAVAFLAFSGPWWLYNLSHDWESMRFLLGGFGSPTQVGLGDKLIGLLLLGFPAVLGLRFPWTMTFWAGMWTVAVALVYTTILILALRSGAMRFLWVMVIGFAAIFVLSSFGVDATGRYLLPLVVPLAIITATEVDMLRQRLRWTALVAALMVVVNLLGTVIAMRTVPPGLTPQFDPATDFPNDYDQEVIAFLKQHGGQHGYATYWVAYRLAFLSGEEIILTPQLPYKASLVYTPSDRYPPYTTAVAQANRPVLVTANLPRLDEIIARQLEASGTAYARQSIGPYTVFYDLSRRMTPAELGLHSLGPG